MRRLSGVSKSGESRVRARKSIGRMPAKSLSGAGDVFSRTRGVHVVGTVEMRGIVVESKRNVPKVSEASVSIALGTCARGMYLAKKSATAKKADGCQSGDFEREENSRHRVRGSEKE